MAWGVPDYVGGAAGATPTKKKGRRRKPPRVPTPYAPTKKGRRAAKAAGELDRIGKRPPPGTPSELDQILRGTPSTFTTPEGTTLPSLVGMTTKQRENLARRGDIANASLEALDAVVDSRGAPSTLEALEIASLGIPGLGLVGVGSKALRGGVLAERALTTSRAIKASEEAARGAGAAARTGDAARKGAAVAGAAKGAERAGRTARAARALVGGSPVRSAAKRAARKVEPAVVRGARQGVSRRVGAAARTLPAPVRAGGRVAGKVATTPVRRPLTTPVAAQAPAFAASGGDPKELMKALEGTGEFAQISAAIGDVGADALPGVAGNALRDALSLPAVVLPSAYISGAAGVEAAKGDTARLDKLWNEYLETGTLPALARGDLEAAARTAGEHPLFTLLEASGVSAIAGRGAGAVARGATRGRVGGTARPPVHIKGLETLGNVNELLGRGRYSPDLIRQAGQRAYDARRRRKQGGDYAYPKQAQRVVGRDIPDRYAFEREQVRRLHRQEIIDTMKEAQPSGRLGRTDKATANVVSLAVQKIATTPETFVEDIGTYRTQLEQAYRDAKAAGRDKEDPRFMARAELADNRRLVKQIDSFLKTGNPEEAVRAANHFIELHGKLTEKIVDQGLLDPDQAAKAAVIPFVRVHLGGGYKEGVGVVDRDGNPLSLETIQGEMKSRGIEPPGFLTHQRRTGSARGAWYRSFFPERQKLPTKKRTGQAVARGAWDPSYRALTEQAARSQSIVDATDGFDGLIRNWSVKPPEGVRDMTTANDALVQPDKYGWKPPPDVPLRPIRTTPFLSLKREMLAAARHQELLDPDVAPEFEALALNALAEATGPGAGPVVYVPESLFVRLEEHFRVSNTVEKAFQAGNAAFKGAVLPFSPSFYIGNFADNAMKAALGGAGPFDWMLGRRVRRQLPEGVQESVNPGALSGSLKRERIHRDASQFEGTSLGRAAQALHAFRETPGPKQFINAFVRSRDFLLEMNSRLFERGFQDAALGKEVRRELQAVSGQWHHALMVSRRAAEDYAKGLTGTDGQIQHAKAVEQLFGNWGKNGPNARGILANLVPFWQWGRASIRFVWLTLPAHHPIKTGLMAAAAEMTEEERMAFGLDPEAEEPLPGYIQGTIPIGDGYLRNIPKYTSFGTFSDLPEFASRMVFAQGSGALAALGGSDWKGDILTKEDGTPQDAPERVKTAVLEAGSTIIPGLNLVESIIQGEASNYSPLAVEGDQEKLDFLRNLANSQQITVPASGSGSDGSDQGSVFGGGSGDVDYGKVFGGGSSEIDYGAVFSGGK